MNDSKFQLERVQGSPVSNEDILADIRQAANLAGTNVMSQRLYSQFGKYDPTTASRRFGTWNKAVLAAGLEIANEINISDDRLFENLMLLWEHFGRQPRSAETGRPPSTISEGAYRRRFRVMKRDNFSCCACGASPALKPGIALHVDHIMAWSRGGDTTDENLQTLCEACNLGKSNVL